MSEAASAVQRLKSCISKSSSLGTIVQAKQSRNLYDSRFGECKGPAGVNTNKQHASELRGRDVSPQLVVDCIHNDLVKLP